MSRNYIHDSLKGLRHLRNEDGLLILEDQDCQLFVVFDGLSSAEHALRGIEATKNYLTLKYQDFLTDAGLDFQSMMHHANQNITKAGLTMAMSTYCAIFTYSDAKFFNYSSMGDSRIYEINSDGVCRMTVDDTLFDGSNVLSKCLGLRSLTKKDFRSFTARASNSRYLLCTDGLYKLFEGRQQDLYRILKEPLLSSVKRSLHEHISGRNSDDATYILID